MSNLPLGHIRISTRMYPMYVCILGMNECMYVCIDLLILGIYVFMYIF